MECVKTHFEGGPSDVEETQWWYLAKLCCEEVGATTR